MILREVLHAHIPTLRSDSTFRDAVDKMDIYQFPGLVVTDQDQKPIAVLTEGDLVRALHNGRSATDLRELPALDYATQDPVTAPPTLEIEAALDLMLQKDITLLPVVEEGVLLGIVLRVDLLQALLMLA